MSRALILMYHIVDVPRATIEGKYCCPPQRFAEQMRFLRDSGRRLVSLDELADRIECGAAFDEGSVVVTFDDGYTETVKHALPIIARLNIPSTMFVLSDRFGATNDWAEGRGFPRRDLLSRASADDLIAAGMTIGSHTRTHPRLPEVDDARLMDEIRGSKEALEQALSRSVDHLAYPFGQVDQRALAAAQLAGYRTACSTRPGFNRGGADRFMLRRIEVFGSDSLAAFRRKLQFGVNDPSPMVPIRYYAARVAVRVGLGQRH